ncbi:MAG: hypothetical protein DMG06_17700 [Acidobacteria bacterium]|nr:MAG: hypothetical protein DMG06_17700 [Acidobacteriota bacterium]
MPIINRVLERASEIVPVQGGCYALEDSLVNCGSRDRHPWTPLEFGHLNVEDGLRTATSTPSSHG